MKVNITAPVPIIIPDKKKGGKRRGKNKKGPNKFAKIQKRTVTMKKHAYQNIQWSINNSGNQNVEARKNHNHSWPSLSSSGRESYFLDFSIFIDHMMISLIQCNQMKMILTVDDGPEELRRTIFLTC